MNTQRYTWPVIIAASLHGALFLTTPHSRFEPREKDAIKSPELPPIPVESMEVAPPEPVPGTETKPSNGGPAIRELQDIEAVLPDKQAFTQPIVERPRAEIYDNSLRDYHGNFSGRDVGPISEGSTVIDFRKLDRQPRATAQISPEYPATMRQQGISGTVTVQFDVDAQGRVVRAEVVNYTRREFAEPAVRAVRNWHFEPGKRNGRAVPFRMTVPIEFKPDVE